MASKSKPNPRVIAVTGASNFLGGGLVRRMLDADEHTRVVAIDVNAPGYEHKRMTYHKVDLTIPACHEVLSHIFSSEGVDTLVHLVLSYTLSRNRSLAHELEAIGTMHVLDACSAANVRRIVARSTTAIYGAKSGNPNFLTESHPVADPRRHRIIEDKIELERQMLQHARNNPDCKVALLRDCTSLGATSQNYLSSILMARRSPRIMGYDPLMQFIHEDDLFRAYHMVVDSEKDGIYNIVGKGVVRYSEAIRMSGGREIRLPGMFLKQGMGLFWSLGLYDIPGIYMRNLKYPWVADGTLAAKELNFIPRYDCFEALEEARRHRQN